MQREYYTVKEISKLIKITEESIRVNLRKGKLKGVKLGKNWIVNSKDFEKYMKKGCNI